MSTAMISAVSSQHQPSVTAERECVETNRTARTWAIGLLAFEVVLLGTLAAYLLSSISWYQNCL